MKLKNIEILKNSIINNYEKYGEERVVIIDNRAYNGNELATEIREETEVGINLVDNLISLCIDLLKRDKINLNEN